MILDALPIYTRFLDIPGLLPTRWAGLFLFFHSPLSVPRHPLSSQSGLRLLP
jgi:hypothetical protein